MTSPTTKPAPPIVIDCRGKDPGELMSKEWLISNDIGAYASGSVVGCNTRRYHGLLVASTIPPVGRVVALATALEQLVLGENAIDLSTFEFPDVISPKGYKSLVEFRNDVAPTFVFRIGEAELTKEILMADSANTVAIRYTLRGSEGKLRFWPFAALRDFHHEVHSSEPHQMTFQFSGGWLSIQDRMTQGEALFVSAGHLGPVQDDKDQGQDAHATFEPRPQWWYRFNHRADISRGQDGTEDLYTPGWFEMPLKDGQSVQVTACLKDPRPTLFDDLYQARRNRLMQLSQSVAPWGDLTAQRLAIASGSFIVNRHFAGKAPSTTILAGFHWFADWGRDAFIALPGLLLTTSRHDLARQVFTTFATAIQNGLVPNCFDDYSTGAHYNSIDASLWFILAAERFMEATGDKTFWRNVLMPAANTILTAYHNGTLFDIHADADGLLAGGSQRTQLTWMDAALGSEVVTPRHGKAVEVNALWYNAHRILADRCRGIDNAMAGHYEHLADLIGPAFVQAFWNDRFGWLNDCISDNWPDATLRPNQVLAVSLPHSPLPLEQQRAVMRVVTEKLLTPYGLRTLSPDDSRFRRRYGGSWESRDRAYHQGTVWAWLMGPFIEGYLKAEEGRPLAVAQAKKWLEPFDAHLLEAGIGYVSEIFDGDAPHHPNGCIAQAWSVSEVLRAKALVAKYER